MGRFWAMLFVVVVWASLLLFMANSIYNTFMENGIFVTPDFKTLGDIINEGR